MPVPVVPVLVLHELVVRVLRAGLVVVRVEKADLTTYRSRLAERLAAARADGLQRDRSRDRWTLDEPEGWFGLPA